MGTTVAGVTSSAGSTRSQLYNPYGIYVTPNGTMFILDTTNYRILRWPINEPMGTVVAAGQGNGAGFNQIGVSYSMFVDDRFNIFISENSNHRITRWSIDNVTAGVLVRFFLFLSLPLMKFVLIDGRWQRCRQHSR